MRRVVLLFGPPGSGKSTLARTLGLDVYDRDDPHWHDDETLFRDALRKVGRDPNAQAVVIRTGSTERARAQARALVRPTEERILDTPADVCRARVTKRGRGDVRGQLAAIDRWVRHTPVAPRRRAL